MLQDLQSCDLKGRDCIANKSSSGTFNCLTSCDGIYADVGQWHDSGALGVRDLIRPLISEYENFKQSNVMHFRFDASATSNNFGRSATTNLQISLIQM